MQGTTNPTKHLMQAGSIKGFEVLSPQNIKNIQNIIVAESVFDGLSVLEMQGFDPIKQLLFLLLVISQKKECKNL